MENSMDRGGWWAPWGHKELDTTNTFRPPDGPSRRGPLPQKCSIVSLYEPVFRIRNCSLSYSKDN